KRWRLAALRIRRPSASGQRSERDRVDEIGHAEQVPGDCRRARVWLRAEPPAGDERRKKPVRTSEAEGSDSRSCSSRSTRCARLPHSFVLADRIAPQKLSAAEADRSLALR